jgi:hypothetical protein
MISLRHQNVRPLTGKIILLDGRMIRERYSQYHPLLDQYIATIPHYRKPIPILSVDGKLPEWEAARLADVPEKPVPASTTVSTQATSDDPHGLVARTLAASRTLDRSTHSSTHSRDAFPDRRHGLQQGSAPVDTVYSNVLAHNIAGPPCTIDDTKGSVLSTAAWPAPNSDLPSSPASDDDVDPGHGLWTPLLLPPKRFKPNNPMP